MIHVYFTGQDGAGGIVDRVEMFHDFEEAEKRCAELFECGSAMNVHAINRRGERLEPVVVLRLRVAKK